MEIMINTLLVIGFLYNFFETTDGEFQYKYHVSHMIAMFGFIILLILHKSGVIG